MTKKLEQRLTTVDNPWDPFDHYDEWNAYDTLVLGYHTNSYLARVLNFSEESSENFQDNLMKETLLEVIINDPLDVYRIVSREVEVLTVE